MLKPNQLRLHPGYFDEAITNLDALVETGVEKIRESGIQFDSVVGTGLSGTLVVPALAKALGVNWAIVRKPNEGSHDFRKVVGTLGKRWLFVDDFVSMGTTLRRVQDTIQQQADRAEFKTKYVGAYLYREKKVALPGQEMAF